MTLPPVHEIPPRDEGALPPVRAVEDGQYGILRVPAAAHFDASAEAGQAKLNDGMAEVIYRIVDGGESVRRPWQRQRPRC